MNFFESVNKLLNDGWKMTDEFCEKCQTAYMISKEKTNIKCPNCLESKICSVENAPLPREECKSTY